MDYTKCVQRLLDRPDPAYIRHPGVAPSWDNSARRVKDACILNNANPDAYERWLRAVVARTIRRTQDNRLVFINAWNEWAEGCHLEPCQKWGRSYLEATKRALESGLTEATVGSVSRGG